MLLISLTPSRESGPAAVDDAEGVDRGGGLRELPQQLPDGPRPSDARAVNLRSGSVPPPPGSMGTVGGGWGWSGDPPLVGGGGGLLLPGWNPSPPKGWGAPSL